MLDSGPPRLGKSPDCQRNAQTDDSNLRWGEFRHNMRRISDINFHGMLDLTRAEH